MSETSGLNIRFLAHGMVKLSPDQLPQKFFELSREEQIKWAREYWDSLSKEDMLKALAYIDIEEDSVPDCLEVDGDDYPVLAQTAAWATFNRPEAQVLMPEKERNAD